MGKGFEIIRIRPESGITYVLGKNKFQYAIGTMIGKNGNRPSWKRYITDTNVPEGVTLDEVATYLFSSRNPLKDDLEEIISVHNKKHQLFESKMA